ncbi:doubled CXXCH motif-containing protein [Hydrogenophaga taeniospiralis CCUG 15921]|uniref:Doubled CXXCH motif-containing protein n=1 Tax=Hydrogenophaga taeniospiralis CCUG 15921 TaxID=1281780 RepID=A0A9X4NPP4_9BURK|nr:tetrathionate reductase family octaheme c-type cytochrome [Hydrogenophaga taeniospiralis]MDG5975400.1 doubled CXXCH motif-containing protein [Hydrogenophaga taeniospiralis CCUG 15921]
MNQHRHLYPPPRQRRSPWRALAAGLAFALAAPLAGATAAVPAPELSAAQALAAAPMSSKSTADHSKFKELQGPFASGSEVTKVCLSCHTEAGKQVMGTRHWTWEYTNPDTGQKLGKKTMLNSFCIGDRSNEAFCQACHIGYGWKDKTFDFHNESKVDCLACHNSGGYKKPPGMAGEVPTERTELPPGSGKFIDPVDLAMVAQHVGKTRTANCGTCHYNGGGGDGVKHGDLDSSLNKASKELDVHLASKAGGGAGFTCATCHQSDGHQIAGSRISMTASDPHGPMLRGDTVHAGRNAATCQSCHGDKPHKQPSLSVELLNNHTNKLACQSCHIPEFARGGVATKMSWDWSTAGRLTPEGKPIQKKDEHGHVIYDSKKGDFKLAENVVPEYLWFNGTVNYTTQDMKIDPTQVVKINSFMGSPDDPKARIWPVKRFQGQQPYDKVHLQLLVPHTAVPDDTAFWFNFDWNKALQTGATATGQPYSGQHGFVKTEMRWPITHMVAPSKNAVACASCHTGATKSRLGSLPGVYLPARDSQPWIDRLGWLAVVGALGGVLVHSIARIVTRRRSTTGGH